MNLLRLAAIACFVIALICVAVPTTIAIGPLGWVAAGLLAWALEPGLVYVNRAS